MSIQSAITPLNLPLIYSPPKIFLRNYNLAFFKVIYSLNNLFICKVNDIMVKRKIKKGFIIEKFLKPFNSSFYNSIMPLW